MQLRVHFGPFQAVDKAGHAREREPVENLRPPPLFLDQSGFPQNRKMPRHRAPSQAAGGDQVADALLAASAQFAYDLHPGRMRQSLEDVVDRKFGYGFLTHTNQLFREVAK